MVLGYKDISLEILKFVYYVDWVVINEGLWNEWDGLKIILSMITINTLIIFVIFIFFQHKSNILVELKENPKNIITRH